MIYWPETLLDMVITQIHYAPDSWKGKAHTGSTIFSIFCRHKILRLAEYNLNRSTSALISTSISDTVRKEFGHLFELKAKFLVEELLSPILTPFILLFW